MKSSRALWLCYGGMVCVAIGVNLLPVYLTTFAEDFGGLGEQELGLIATVMFAGLVAGILLSGPLADRLGARPFVVGGPGLIVVGLVMMALAQGYHALLVASFVMGFGAGALDMVLSPIVSALCPERRSSAMNRLHAFYCVGGVGTVVVASAGLHFDLPWRWVTAGIALAPGLLLVGFAWAWLPPLVHPDHDREGIGSLLRRPRFYAALLAIALAGATEAGMVTWLPAYSERVLGYTRATGGMALAAFSVAMAVGRMSASGGVGRIGPHALLAGAGVACAGLYTLGALSPVAPVALGACVLVGLGCSAIWPTNLGITADRFPQGGATMFALLAGIGNAGCLVIPWVEGVVAEHWGLRVSLLAGAVAPAVLVVLVGAFWVTDRKSR